MNGLYAVLILLIAGLMFLLPPALQYKNGINPEYFPKIKVHKLAFMFRGMGSKDGAYRNVTEYGVIAPMYALHVFGYALSALSIVIAPVVIFAAEIEVWQTALIVLYMFVAEVIICAATVITCYAISRKKGSKAKPEAQAE